jgi:benzoate 4-monooxygenase
MIASVTDNIQVDYAFGKAFGFLDKEEDYLKLIATIDARGEVLNALGHLPQFFRPYMRYFILDPFWPNGLRTTFHRLKHVFPMEEPGT